MWTGLVVSVLLIVADVASSWVGVAWSGSARPDRAYVVLALHAGRVGGGLVNDMIPLGGSEDVAAGGPGWRFFSPQAARKPFEARTYDPYDPTGRRIYVTLWPFAVVAGVPTIVLWWRARRPERGRCRHCQVEFKANATVCAGCGLPREPADGAAVSGRMSFCGYCGYDLSGTSGELCPECGNRPSVWDLRDDKVLRRLRLIHLGAASSLVLWLVLASIAYAAACVTVGRPGMQNHPIATTTLYVLWIMGFWVPLLALAGPGVLWFLIAGRLAKFPMSARACASVLLRTLVAYLVCWALTVALAFWDPLGALSWMVD